jgi:hypothetical protein
MEPAASRDGGSSTSISSRPVGQDGPNSTTTPIIKIIASANADSGSDHDHPPIVSSSASQDKSTNDQHPGGKISFPNLAGSDPSKMAPPAGKRAIEEQESSADERTGLVGDHDAVRDYAATGGSSSRASGSERVEGGSMRRRKATKPRTGLDSERKPKSWLESYKEKYGSIELDNVGSTARDHLALGELLMPFSGLKALLS